MYKFLSMITVVVASIAINYSLERKVYKSSRNLAVLTWLSFALAWFEYMKFEFPNQVEQFEKLQDIILLYIPSFVYTAFRDFTIKDKLKKQFAFLMHVIPGFYAILALTNDFHNIFWNGTIFSNIYNSYRPKPTAFVNSYYFYLLYLTLLIVMDIKIELKRTTSRFLRRVMIIYLAIWILGLLFFKFDYNYPLVILALSFLALTSQLTFIRYTWKALMLSSRSEFFERSDDGYILFDKEGRIVDCNSAALMLLNMRREDVLWKNSDKINELVQATSDILKVDDKFLLKRIEEMDDKKVLVLRDVTEQVVASKGKDYYSSLLQGLFENVSQAVLILDENGTIVDCNKQFESMFDYKREELVGRKPEDFIVPEELKSEPQKIREMALKQGVVRIRTVRKRRTGELVDVEISVVRVRTSEGDILYSIYSDVSLEREFLRTSSSILQRDPLTGLYNREYFVKRLVRVLEEERDDYIYNAVIFIDINNFSHINVSKGHSFADELLRKVAERFSEVIRSTDTVSRAVSDEFWILIEKFARTQVEANERIRGIVRKLIERLEEAYFVQGEVVNLEFTFGVYIFESDRYDEVLRKASIALKEAKERGEKYAIYSPKLDEKFAHIFEKEKLFKTAFYSGGLKVFFQPICTSKEKPVGAEALLRVVDDKGNVHPPLEFIPIIESNGMIHMVGEEVLRQSCEALKSLNGKLKFVDINVSPVQFMNPNFADRYADVVKEAGVDPSKIVIEVTENIILGTSEVVKTNIKKLLDYGFQLCIDDFGTGYSSLLYLVEYPLKKIKVDRSFVKGIPGDKKAVRILEAIMSLSRSLGIDAIPEGVENERQLELLSLMGYRLFQGFYFSPPLSFEDFTKFLNNRE
ncbi:EAL domain-containing protein [Fervidobacterium thailandense]|uniref:Diguanylate cyclase n=1 Tax=Fervidobacterium thailandense TaxID=1008305 RepID=A0A1E3G2L8_9BACT|nr:EAL domain-containing protein [Fervidobacterium thailandense]ODN30459.1 hypothetical protein A4H02_05360 [Fervidobacterium thailandense]